MKNMLHISKHLFLFGMLWMALPLFAFEYTYQGNTLEYTVLSTSADGTTAYVSVQEGSTEPQGEVVIPGRFAKDGVNYEVTTVAAEAFAYCNKVTSFELPSTITDIRDKGFYSCSKMTSVSLNEGLKFIGDRAFCNDSAVVGTFVVPSTVDTIADYAFGKMLSVKNIQFLRKTPASVGGGQVFLQTLANARIMIPCGSYDVYASYYYAYLSTVTNDSVRQYFWRDKVTDLCDENPIFGDDKLRYRVIDTTKKEASVFGYWSGAIDGELQIPASVEVMGSTYNVVEVDSNVFNGRELRSQNVRITSLVMPSTMRKINYAAFRACHSLSSVTLNEGLEYLGNRAFCKDSMLTSITIPSTVTFMGDYSIGDCPNLQWVEMLPATPPESDGGPLSGVPAADKCDITVACGTRSNANSGYMTTRPWMYRVVDVCKFNKDNIWYSRTSANDTEVQADGPVTRKAGALTIPASVRAGKYELSVTKVADGAFSELAKGGHWLTSLEIAGSVRHIGKGAFRDCVNLTQVRMHEGVQVIGNRAFCRDSALTMIVIPSTVDSMGGYAFGICPKLSSIYVLGSTPPKRQVGDNNPFNGVSAKGTLLVYCPDLEAYENAWNGILKEWTWGENCRMNIYHHNYPDAENLLTEYDGNDVRQYLYHRIFTSGQWETLYLPFEVESVTLYDTDDKAEVEIAPWVKGTGGNFWLLKQSGNDAEGNPEFVTTDKVEGFTPYLIQFKHPWYDDKTVTFQSVAAEDALDVETTFAKRQGSTLALFGNNTLARQTVSGVYLLEEDGTVFQHSSLSRTLYPFECYAIDGAGVASQSRRFAIHYREAVPTDGGMSQIDGGDMVYTVDGNTLTVYTGGSAIRVYGINGTLLYAFPAGTETAVMNLESGYYIVASQYGSRQIVL